jgi:hypothetical protein
LAFPDKSNSKLINKQHLSFQSYFPLGSSWFQNARWPYCVNFSFPFMRDYIKKLVLLYRYTNYCIL